MGCINAKSISSVRIVSASELKGPRQWSSCLARVFATCGLELESAASGLVNFVSTLVDSA